MAKIVRFWVVTSVAVFFVIAAQARSAVFEPEPPAELQSKPLSVEVKTEGKHQPPNAGRGAGSVPLWNPHKPEIGNLPLTVRVLVLNYDPVVAEQGHRRLTQVFRWSSPAILATDYKEAMEYASGGYLRYDIVEWRNLNEIYAKEDGYRYTVEEYVRNRRGKGDWGKHGNVDYPRLLHEQNVVPLVDDGLIDEVWIFSDHYFGLWEASMAGPGAFFINGGVYPQVPSRRPFAFYGFNYERDVAEMMHNTSHRTECTMNRIYGAWRLKAPRNNWEKFSAYDKVSGGLAGVGNCHFPPNANNDYDYANPREVTSWADAFLTYPTLDLVRKPVTRSTWSKGPNYHLDYMKWYFAHIPRAAGRNPDGKFNNWFKYIFDFHGYNVKGEQRPPIPELHTRAVADPKSKTHVLSIVYRSGEFVDPASLDENDIRVTSPDGKALPVRLLSGNEPGNRSFRVAHYEVAAPPAGWEAAPAGDFLVALKSGQVRLTNGQTVPEKQLGSFQVAPAGAGSTLPLTNLLVDGSFEEDTKGRWSIHSFRGNAKAVTVVSDETKVGKKAIAIQAEKEEDAGYKQKVAVKANTRYQLTAWVKTKDVTIIQKGGRTGANLCIIGGEVSKTLLGTHDWTQLTLDFNSGKRTQVEIWARLGHNGSTVTGTAWFDDLCLVDLSGSALQGVEALVVRLPQGSLQAGERGVARAYGKLKSGAERDVTREVAWSSTNPEVAAIDTHGNIRFGRAGKATVTAQAGGLTAKGEVTVIDPGLPQARLMEVRDVTKPGPEPVTITVAYEDPDGIRRESLDLGDVRVHGPNGFHQFAKVASIEAVGTTGFKVSYQVTPPAFQWADADRGNYSIEVTAYQVADLKGNHVPMTPLGLFRVLPSK